MRVSVCFHYFLDNTVLMKIPTNAEMVRRNCLLIPFSPKKPIHDLAAIITNDVPIASLTGSLHNTTNAGISNKPTPASINPVITATIAPSTSTEPVIKFLFFGLFVYFF